MKGEGIRSVPVASPNGIRAGWELPRYRFQLELSVRMLFMCGMGCLEGDFCFTTGLPEESAKLLIWIP